VDSYYPGNRVAVVCHGPSWRYRELFAQAIPAHGLRLLALVPGELAGDREVARQRLEQMIGELGPPPRPMAAARTVGATPAPAQPAAPPTRLQQAERQTSAIVVGLALLSALVLELHFGVAGLGFDSGRVVLAFGFSLDACARTTGTIAAWRAGSLDWAWGCLLAGSPLTVGFALMQQGGPVETEPAPLAGLVGALALLVLAAAVLTGS
jgi:hypothetical protein